MYIWGVLRTTSSAGYFSFFVSDTRRVSDTPLGIKARILVPGLSFDSGHGRWHNRLRWEFYIGFHPSFNQGSSAIKLYFMDREPFLEAFADVSYLVR